MRRITQDFNTCGDTLISSNCVIYPHDDLTLRCDNLCFPSNLTDIVKCINDSISLAGLDLKCAAPNCVDCFEFTIKNVLQLLLDKVCVPFDCVAAKACIDCNYIKSCITIPTPEPRITCNEIKTTCIDCDYINSCVSPYVLNCTSVQDCVGVQYLETTLYQSFDFATYNNVSGVFNFNCDVVKAPGCIDCEYIRSCIPTVTCAQVLPCITCAFLQSKIDEPGCLTFPTQDVSFSSPYIYFKTIKDEFNEILIHDFKAIEQAPATNLCSGVTYDLFNAKTNLSLISGSLAAIETYMNNNYATTVTSGVVSNSGTMVVPGIYHLQIKSTCGGNIYIGNEIQFEIISTQNGKVRHSLKSDAGFNDSKEFEDWVAVANPSQGTFHTNDHHYLCIIYGDSFSSTNIQLSKNNKEIHTTGFRQTFNNLTGAGNNSQNSYVNPYSWIVGFKNWFEENSGTELKYVPDSSTPIRLVLNTGETDYSNNFKIRSYSPTIKVTSFWSLANHNYGNDGELRKNTYYTNSTGISGDIKVGTSNHLFLLTPLKLTKPL